MKWLLFSYRFIFGYIDNNKAQSISNVIILLNDIEFYFYDISCFFLLYFSAKSNLLYADFEFFNWPIFARHFSKFLTDLYAQGERHHRPIYAGHVHNLL